MTSAEQLSAAELSGLNSVSNRVAILYGGTQQYDHKTGTLTLVITLRNNSDAPIRGPFKLEATDIDSAYLNVEVANAANHALGGGAVWDVTSSVPGGVLAPGATSQPCMLTLAGASCAFHCEVVISIDFSPAPAAKLREIQSAIRYRLGRSYARAE